MFLQKLGIAEKKVVIAYGSTRRNLFNDAPSLLDNFWLNQIRIISFLLEKIDAQLQINVCWAPSKTTKPEYLRRIQDACYIVRRRGRIHSGAYPWFRFEALL